MNSLARSREYINCLRGLPVPDTTNGVLFPERASHSMNISSARRRNDADFWRDSIYELGLELRESPLGH
jgi:hypothetical protein